MTMRDIILAAILLSSPIVVSQSTTSTSETIHAVVVYHNGCDRTDIAINGGRLTSKGATECFNSGSFFQKRYFSDAASHINGTSSVYSENAPGVIKAVTPQGAENFLHIIQSGTAIMQGLFPPVNMSPGRIITGAESQGGDTASDVTADRENPVNGYQYFVVDSHGKEDPQSIELDGMRYCPTHDRSKDSFMQTKDFAVMLQNTNDLYISLYGKYMTGVDITPSFKDAYRFYDYIAQNRDTNTTLANVTDAELVVLRSLASIFQFNRYANLSTSPSSSWRTLTAESPPNLRDVGGRTLMASIINHLVDSAQYIFKRNQFNLLVGSFENFLSFFAITGLDKVDPSFRTLPNFGASLMFEVFSENSDSAVIEGNFVDTSKMHVRFLFKNGTDDDAKIYPLFGNQNANKTMSWNDFSLFFANSSLTSKDEWCRLCLSYADFCDTTETILGGGPTGLDGSLPGSSKRRVSPAVAGVIGALVTLALTAALATLAFFVFGFFLTRDPRRRRASIMSGLRREKYDNESEIELPLSPRASAMGQGGNAKFDSIRSTDAGLVKLPGSAHLKDLEDRA